jgi:hypothetical protein
MLERKGESWHEVGKIDAFIYFSGRLQYGLDEIEDAIDSAIAGLGEVTGTGTGEAGSNVDVFIESGELTKESALRILREVLEEFDFSGQVSIVIDGERFLIPG